MPSSDFAFNTFRKEIHREPFHGFPTEASTLR